jgi:hypothetical protein
MKGASTAGGKALFDADLQVGLHEDVLPVVMEGSLVETPKPRDAQPPSPESTQSNGLTPKRKEWAIRAAKEAGMDPAGVENMIQRLESASATELKVFFDGLAAKRIVLPVAS